MVLEKDLLVVLCKLDTAILAASVAKSGCFVVRVAAVSAASSSSSWVETPS